MKREGFYSVPQVLIAALFMVATVLFQVDAFGVKTLLSSYLHFAATGGIVVAALGPFVVTPELTAIAVAYKNEAYIADLVLPRVTVGKQAFKYKVFNKADTFSIPDTKVARASAPNRISFGFSETSSFTIDRALDDPIPNEDIANAPEGFDPKAHAAASVMDLILLDHEKATADLVFNADNYASTNKATLSGESQFTHASATPYDTVETALETCVMRPNIITFGQAAWVAFKRHANVIARVLGSANAKGIVTRQAVAEALEVEQVLVGRGRYNSAAKGQTPVLSRLWDDSVALIFQDKMADTRGRITFGYTAQFGNRVGGTIEDPDCGMNGGVRVRSGESVRELITANDLGYLLSDVCA